MVQEGDRIELVHTSDQYTHLEPGDRGTVTGISRIPAGVTGDRPERQVDVDWDSGSTLSLIHGEDKYRVISDEDCNS